MPAFRVCAQFLSRLFLPPFSYSTQYPRFLYLRTSIHRYIQRSVFRRLYRFDAGVRAKRPPRRLHILHTHLKTRPDRYSSSFFSPAGLCDSHTNYILLILVCNFHTAELDSRCLLIQRIILIYIVLSIKRYL